jgi:hypothetical protein
MKSIFINEAGGLKFGFTELVLLPYGKDMNTVCAKTSGRNVEGWTKPHKDEFYKFYFSPNVIRMIKSKRTRWASDVAHATIQSRNVKRRVRLDDSVQMRE